MTAASSRLAPQIGQRASTGNEYLTDLLMAKIDLNAIAGIKPVVRPGLRSLAASANPTPDNILRHSYTRFAKWS